MSRKWMAYTVWEWSWEVTVISLAPLGMISQQGEPGSTGTLAERWGRHSDRGGKREREGEAEGTCMVKLCSWGRVTSLWAASLSRPGRPRWKYNSNEEWVCGSKASLQHYGPSHHKQEDCEIWSTSFLLINHNITSVIPSFRPTQLSFSCQAPVLW